MATEEACALYTQLLKLMIIFTRSGAVRVGREGSAGNLCQSRRYTERRAWRWSLVWRGGKLEGIDWVESDLRLGWAATVGVHVSHPTDLPLHSHLRIIKPLSTIAYFAITLYLIFTQFRYESLPVQSRDITS